VGSIGGRIETAEELLDHGSCGGGRGWMDEGRGKEEILGISQLRRV